MQRDVNQNDRRKFELTITDKGNEIIKAIYPIVTDYRKRALEGLTTEQITQMKKNLEQIIANSH